MEKLRAILESPEGSRENNLFVIAEALRIFAVTWHRLESLWEEQAHPLLVAA